MVSKDTALRCLEYINLNDFLMERFKKQFPNNTLTQVWDAVKAELVPDKVKETLLKIVPECYEINDKIFLKGSVSKEKFDFIGDGMDHEVAIELFDMTEEMKTGDSYTFYVSTTGYFKEASVTDTVMVIKYLESLK